MPRMRPRLAVALVLAMALLVGLAIGGRVWWQRAHRSDLARALATVPADSLRVSFTDWSAVRRQLRVEPGARPDSAVVERLVDKAYDTDLSAASSIDESAVALQQHYGFSPATAQWEAYAQGRDGAAMVLRLPEQTDFTDLARRLAELGYRKPARPDGVWRGGVDVAAAVDPTISPELQHVVLLADRHLVVSSDAPDYAARVARIAAGQGRSLFDRDPVRASVSRLGAPANAIIWAGDFACRDLAMSQADEGDQALAKQAVSAAGGVTPLTGLVMSMSAGRTLSVVQQFPSDDLARRNLRPRARLAVGDAVGRGGTFADSLELTGSRADGDSVVLTLRPAARTGYVLSALYSGPLLFATC